jgi:peptidoglycan hydrolase-like protein with peptidoglycan-binding domain
MVIKEGHKGESVKKVQRALQRHGIDVDDDGDFGPKTRRAVEAFQRQNELDVDGKAGPDTLGALGLDPDTLEEVSVFGGSSSGGGTTVAEEGAGVATITFTEEETVVPEPVIGRVREYVRLTVDTRREILASLVNAVAQFETTMQFASSDEATPDAFGVVLKKLFEDAVDQLVDQVPGLSIAKAYFDEVTDELGRAAAAAKSHDVGAWIRDQRAEADRLRRETVEGNLQADTESSYLEQDEEGRQAFFEMLFEATEGMMTVHGPTINDFERQLYEAWINAQFRSISDDASGCIEYRFEYFDQEFEFESCSVETPFGNRVASRLNELMDAGELPGYERPLDFAVRKKVGIYTEGFTVGGKSRYYGWLDEANEEIHLPVSFEDLALEGFRDPRWRTMVARFRES